MRRVQRRTNLRQLILTDERETQRRYQAIASEHGRASDVELNIGADVRNHKAADPQLPLMGDKIQVQKVA